jgi:uncharacterized RDD family membrane protein YckC
VTVLEINNLHMNNKNISTQQNTTAFSYPRRLKIFASMMYEGMLLFGVVFVGDYLFDTLTQSDEPSKLMWQRQLTLFLILGAYFLLSWFRRGQTVAMKAWGIALRNKLHPRLTWLQAISRYILMWVIPLIGAYIVHLVAVAVGWNSITMFVVVCPFLNLIPSLFRKDRQMLHDVLVGTELINIKK